MELTGRLTKDAVIQSVNDEKQVVNFTIAINEYYKPKDATEGKQTTLYVSCGYWQNTAVATRLLKGAVVEVEGIMYIRVYAGRDGEPKAATNFRCRHIKVFGVTAKRETTGQGEQVEGANGETGKLPLQQPEHIAAITEPMDDMPF